MGEKETNDILKQLLKDVQDLRAENADMREKMKSKANLPDMERRLNEIKTRNEAAAIAQQTTVLIEEPAVINGKMKKDVCPFCTSWKTSSLLDMEPSGRWSCRKCGKHWQERVLGLKYHKKLEFVVDETSDLPAECVSTNGVLAKV